MKKLVALLLLASVVLPVMAFGAMAESYPTGVYGSAIADIRADIDGDRMLTNSDIALMIRYLSGWTVDGTVQDITNDGKLNNRDAIAMILLLNAA